jgi:hypothetical protein
MAQGDLKRFLRQDDALHRLQGTVFFDKHPVGTVD